MEEHPDNVSNIHNRFSLTLLNPSSHYFSLAASLAIAVVISLTTYLGYLGHVAFDDVWYRIPLVVAVLALTQLLDTRFTRKKEYSKSLHSSLFANMLWVVTILMGLLASLVLDKEPSLFFVTFGMLLYASFRIGIYTTTLGADLRKAWAICLVQPLAMFLVLIPQDMWAPMLTDPLALGYGISFMVIATVWSFLTDRAGRPGMESTHKTIQAYLASQKNDFTEAEEIMEQRSSSTEVSTSQILVSSGGAKFRLVLPEIHPGPYHPVGGSNIPYLMYQKWSSSAMVMHSISDHSLNLPSQQEVGRYLASLDKSMIKEKGAQCTEPVTIQKNKARVTGLLFGTTPLLFLSLSPHGMEDIPNYMKTAIEEHAHGKGHSRPMLVDCHNAMGEVISDEDGRDMQDAARSCLDALGEKPMLPVEFGYSNSDAMDVRTEDLGMGGLGVACLRINKKEYFLGWADANNMENGTREDIVSDFARRGLNFFEICTSDTHYAPVKARNRNGYYHLGLITGTEKISKWFLEIARRAQSGTAPAEFEILESQASVQVMGQGIYEDYSRALDNSLKITKGFVIGGVALFITSLFL